MSGWFGCVGRRRRRGEIGKWKEEERKIVSWVNVKGKRLFVIFNNDFFFGGGEVDFWG